MCAQQFIKQTQQWFAPVSESMELVDGEAHKSGTPAARLNYTHFALLHCIRRFHASFSSGDQLHLVGRLPKRTTSWCATKHNSLGIS